MESPRKYIGLNEAKRKIEHYCAYQDRCHKEVIEKLQSFGIYGVQNQQLIGHLIEENYLNETRFAQAFARGKFRIKKWGKNRILRELKLRNISDYNIKKGLQEIDEEEYQMTLEILIKKFWIRNEKHPLKIRKKKVVDALYYRGWESTLIYDQMHILEKESNK